MNADDAGKARVKKRPKLDVDIAITTATWAYNNGDFGIFSELAGAYLDAIAELRKIDALRDNYFIATDYGAGQQNGVQFAANMARDFLAGKVTE